MTPWTVAARLLCPWDSPAKNTGGGCHFLLQGIFPTQGTHVSWIAGGFFTTELPGRSTTCTPPRHHFHILRMPAADCRLSLSGVGWGVERTWAPPAAPLLASALSSLHTSFCSDLSSRPRGPRGSMRRGLGSPLQHRRGPRTCGEREPSLLPRALGKKGACRGVGTCLGPQ